MTIDRRVFLGAVAGGLLGTRVAGAQKRGPYRIGGLSLTSNDFGYFAALREPLAKHGYVVDRDMVFVERFADGKADRLPALAAELVQLKPDLIVAGPLVAIRDARDATSTIPIVMAFSGDDPVKAGLVASLAHPGANVTGVTASARDLATKWVQLLRDAVPSLSRIAVLAIATRPDHPEHVGIMQAALPRGVVLQPIAIDGPAQLDTAFAAMTKERAEGFVILADVLFTRSSQRIAELALSHRLASIYLFREYAVAGGLMAYGPDHLEIFVLAAQYIDNILKGAKPGDLPVQQPTSFELTLNNRTANALGLTLPQSLLQRATEVIR